MIFIYRIIKLNTMLVLFVYLLFSFCALNKMLRLLVKCDKKCFYNQNHNTKTVIYSSFFHILIDGHANLCRIFEAVSRICLDNTETSPPRA